jgi:hypothetical protein
MRIESGDEHLTSLHCRSDAGEKDFSCDARILPILVVPKNYVVAAAHTTCLSRAFHEVASILCPSMTRRGRVITLLVLVLELKLLLECSIPFSNKLDRPSSERCELGRPLSMCTNLIADRYVRMEFGDSFWYW